MNFKSIKIVALGLATTLMIACGGLKTRAISENKALDQAEKSVMLAKADSKVEKAIRDFQTIIDSDTLIDNALLAKFYFVKAKYALAKGKNKENYQNFISAAKQVEEIESRTEYLALNIASTYFDFFSSQEELDAAVAAGTHKEAQVKKVDNKYSQLISNDLTNVANSYVQLGFTEYQNKKLATAAEIFADVYALQSSAGFTGNKMPELLFNAANTNYEAKVYDKAASQFQQLIDEGYTGVSTRYEATSKADKQVYTFNSQKELDALMKTGQYINDTVYQTPDQTATLYVMLTNTYLIQEKYKAALKVVNEGRTKLPDNQDLLSQQGNVYLKLDDMDSFVKNMEEAIKNDPSNPQLYFNVAVVNQQMADKSEGKQKQDFISRAKDSYLKAVEVDADYADAYRNLSVLVLNKEKAINDKINSIKGYSRADRKKIEKYTKEKKVVYKEALVYLEKAYKIDPKNEGVLKTLKGIYYQLDRTADYKKINNELKALNK